MITREIKVGDKIQWLKCGEEKKPYIFEVYEIVSGNVIDTTGMNWTILSSQPEGFEHLDNVNHPPHYTAGDIECIDAIRAALGRDGFIKYCQGNAIKYLWRHEHKGGAEDWKKADWYINRAIKEMEE
jgi:hypothetical protein